MRRPWSETAPTLLAGYSAELHPIAESHRDPLRELARDEAIWTHFAAWPASEAGFAAFFDAMLADRRAGTRYSFAVVDVRTGEFAGSTAYGGLDEANDRLEIGWTWLSRAHQGLGLNRAAKYLLLKHAFEVLACRRVEFKTDVLNVPARRALESIGAREEGVFRSYNYMPSGRRRDAVFYSMLDSEWPEAERALRSRLGTARPG
ncbi:GNAT family N-acetyltransferase [Glycomyces xiaoerkulensis]|uniref:GNAT family N-acetyltransferase n=1 Tax=Glycomyces xiaoerkulensis TaxID=2038139 RepID=UPI000C263E3D|nr:GNAT family protein [Glycomyces xiaoerkulensis]